MNKFGSDHLKSYVCTHVFEKVRPVLLVTHEDDGAWCLLCGDVHSNSAESYRVVGIGHVVAADTTLNDCADLPIGWEAERSDVGNIWLRTKIDSQGS